jgi:hypothetical protein
LVGKNSEIFINQTISMTRDFILASPFLATINGFFSPHVLQIGQNLTHGSNSVTPVSLPNLSDLNILEQDGILATDGAGIKTVTKY